MLISSPLPLSLSHSEEEICQVFEGRYSGVTSEGRVVKREVEDKKKRSRRGEKKEEKKKIRNKKVNKKKMNII
jgi:hypothetical protein